MLCPDDTQGIKNGEQGGRSFMGWSDALTKWMGPYKRKQIERTSPSKVSYVFDDRCVGDVPPPSVAVGFRVQG